MQITITKKIVSGFLVSLLVASLMFASFSYGQSGKTTVQPYGDGNLLINGVPIDGGAPGAYDYLIRINPQNASEYQAVAGNGTVIDGWTSTDAATTLNNTFAAMVAGDLTYINDGVYPLSFAPIISVSNVTVTGAGMYATKLVLNSGVNDNMIYIQNRAGVTLSNIEFDGNMANQEEQPSLDTLLNGVKVTNSTACVFENLYVHDVFNHGINLYRTTYSTVRGCNVTYCGDRNASNTYQSQSGILLFESSNFNEVVNNFVSDINVKGIYISNNCTNNRIDSNTITDMVNSVIGTCRAIHFTSGGCNDNIISNNKITNSLQAIYMSNAGSATQLLAERNTFVGNNIRDVTGTAITISNSTYTQFTGGTITNCITAFSIGENSNRSSITGMTIYANGTALSLNTTLLTITGNFIHGYTNCITEQSNADRNNIQTNTLEGNVTKNGASTIIKNNYSVSATNGCVTEKIVSASNSTATTFVLTTGLSGNVTWAGLDFDAITKAALTAQPSWVQTSLTQITVTIVGTGLPASMTCTANLIYKP